MVVAIKNAGGAVAGDENVGPSIFVEVERRDAESVVAVGAIDVCFVGDIFKCAIAAIVVQNVGDGGKFRGRAVHGIFVAAGFAVRHAPIKIAGDKQIEAPVVVIIEKAGGDRPAARRHPCLGGDIRKCAVTIIVVENVFPEVGHIDIGIAVVVVVSDGHTHPVIALVYVCQACLLGDIREAAIPILTIQPVPIGRFVAIEVREFGQRISNMAGIHKKNVQQAVVIIVQERDATGHGLDEVFSGSRGVAENKINTLGKANLEPWAGAGGRGLGNQAERAEQRKGAGFGESCRRQFESLSRALRIKARAIRFLHRRCARTLMFSSREEFPDHYLGDRPQTPT